MKPRAKKILVMAGGALLLLGFAGLGTVVAQGRRAPSGEPHYVALGSSFAAGAGLGALQPGSPVLCARSVNGYPPRLSRLLGIELVDMSCGGAVTKHLLSGGQFFQGPQIDAITSATRLVTITAGGNDVGYIGDLSMLAARHTDSLFGRGVRWRWSGPKAAAERDFADVTQRLAEIVTAVHRRAPAARVVLATYPTILPARGTCPTISLTNAEAATMRSVGDALALATIAAARQSGAMVVDMNALGRGHDACSPAPWVRGWTNGGSAPFHPTMLGAQATAEAIARALAASPEGVAAIRKDDATRHQAGSVAGQE